MELNNYIRISFYQIILYKNKLILKHVTHIVQTVNLKLKSVNDRFIYVLICIWFIDIL